MADYFDPRTERKLKALGQRNYIKTLCLTLLWFALVAVAWFLLIPHSGGSPTEPSSFIFPLLLILPFSPFHAHRVLFGKTFYGKVVLAQAESKPQGISAGGVPLYRTAGKAFYATAEHVVVVGGNGERLDTFYREPTILGMDYYQKGDRVLVIRGLRYPVKCPIPEDVPYVCPSCSHHINIGQRRCGWCKAEF